MVKEENKLFSINEDLYGNSSDYKEDFEKDDDCSDTALKLLKLS